MGVRERLILVVALVLGASLVASLALLLRLDDHEERRLATERGTDLMEFLAVALRHDLERGDRLAVTATLQAAVRSRETLELSEAVLLDVHGTDLSSPQGQQRRMSPTFAAFLEEASASRVPLTEPERPAWPRRLSMPLLVKGLRYTLVVELDEREVNRRLVLRFNRMLVTTASISLFALLVLLTFLKRHVLQPLVRLSEMAAAMKAGELDRRVQPRGARELQVLARTLNEAAAGLQGRKAELEAAVAARTLEIGRANAELQAANERLHALAVTDPLTGLWNRRALEQALGNEVVRQRREQRPFAVLMLDVDHFKVYNDQNGHPAGDLALKIVAATLTTHVRASDMVARVGGEEFVVFLPATEAAAARATAEKVRAAVADAAVPHGKSQPLGRLTVSVGVAVWPDHGDTVPALLAAVDAALYAAKHAGRNRVCEAAVANTAASPAVDEENPV